MAVIGAISSRVWAGTLMWDRRHAGKGSTYVGSWQNVSQFQTKTLAVLSSMAGSLFTVVGALGTGVGGLTGTYDRQDLSAGTYRMISFTEAVRFVKPIVLVGSVGSGKGSLSLAVLRQT